MVPVKERVEYISEDTAAIVVEGPFLTGKTTQIERISPYLDRSYDVEVISEENTTRELIDSIDFDGYAYRDIGPVTESLLWASHYTEKAEELSQIDAEVALLDRFIHSTIAFQDLQMEDSSLEDITDYLMEPFGTNMMDYDLAIFYTVDPDGFRERYRKREEESIPEETLQRGVQIQRRYMELTEVLPSTEVIPTAGKDIDTVYEETIHTIEDSGVLPY